MLIICQQFLHLMPLPTVTGVLSNECPKLSPTPYVYNLSWDLKSRSADQSVLLDKFCKYKVNIIKFQLILCPQSTKTAGKNDPSTAEKKEQVLWNLKPLRHLCYTAWHTYICIYGICIHLYIYYVVCVRGYTKSPTSTPFQTVTNLNWPKISEPNSPGFPWPIDPSRAGPRPMKYCGWSMTETRKLMGLWNIPYMYNWVVV